MSAPPSDRHHAGTLFGGPTSGSEADRDFRAIRDGAEFRELRRRTLRFALPATALFMGNYLLFVLLSAYAPRFMATPALGEVNVGMLLGVLQFVTTMLIVDAYCRYARRHTDPLADALRDEVESADAGAAGGSGR